MKKRNNKGRPAALVSQKRRQRAVALINAGATQADVSRDLGVTQAAISKALKKLRQTMTVETQATFEEYRRSQLSILELMESALLEGKLPVDVHQAWLRNRLAIADLLGINAPHRTLSIKTEIGNEQTKGFYVEFARRTMKLKHPESWARLWKFIEDMPDDYGKNIPALPPANAGQARDVS
jgi:predicted transcriptional regulator